MGRVLPVFLAFVLNCSGIFVFTTPKSLDCLPYLSYIIFLTSVFFLLWDIKLRPSSFRRLFSLAEMSIEFVISMLIMEVIMNNFWFPLEIGFITVLPKIADFVSDLFYKYGYSCTGVCEIIQTLKTPGTLLIASYLLSIFFFFCIIHATRVVDFRILKRCGVKAFLSDSCRRGQKLYSRLIAQFRPDCRAKIRFAPGTKGGHCPMRDSCDEDDGDEWINSNDYTFGADDYCSCTTCSSRDSL